jgi:hypothetical protein
MFQSDLPEQLQCLIDDEKAGMLASPVFASKVELVHTKKYSLAPEPGPSVILLNVCIFSSTYASV